MKRNLTIQLDEDTIKDARIIAAKRSMSISGLVSEAIRQAAAKESNYNQVKEIELERLAKGYNFGTDNLPKRDDLYDR